ELQRSASHRRLGSCDGCYRALCLSYPNEGRHSDLHASNANLDDCSLERYLGRLAARLSGKDKCGSKRPFGRCRVWASLLSSALARAKLGAIAPGLAAATVAAQAPRLSRGAAPACGRDLVAQRRRR